MVDLFHLLREAATQALPVTDIPRVPLVPKELHKVIWSVHAHCRHVDPRTGVSRLMETAKQYPNSTVGRFVRQRGCLDTRRAITKLRLQVLLVLGLPRWL